MAIAALREMCHGPRGQGVLTEGLLRGGGSACFLKTCFLVQIMDLGVRGKKSAQAMKTLPTSIKEKKSPRD